MHAALPSDFVGLALVVRMLGIKHGPDAELRSAVANAQVRRRRLQQFNVCGMGQAKAVLLWHALAHNLKRMAALDMAFAG